MAEKTQELFPFRVKPKHQVVVRGIEYTEGQTVMMSTEEHNAFAAKHPDYVQRLVTAEMYDLFIAEYVAGKIDHTGNPIIPTAPEAEGQPEAGPVPPVEESAHV